MECRLCIVLVLLAACEDSGDGLPMAGIDGGGGQVDGAVSKDTEGQGGARPADAGASGAPDLESTVDAAGGQADEIAARTDFFRNEIVHRIEIIVDPAMWQAFMEVHRSFAPKPMNTWFRAEFRIDGTPLRDVAFHSFGWGSRDYNKDKPNLSIDLDRFAPGQSLRGIERIRIKNNGQDMSGLRQAILYQAMRESNLMAPRSTYADLFVNGEPYGYYFVEESFTEGFVRERTGNGNGAAYEPAGCQGLLSPAEGGCDKMADWFTRPFNSMVGAGEDLAALCRAMNGPPEQLLSALAPLIIVSEWIDQLAIDTALAGDRDGFSVTGSNFRLYHDTSLDKLRLVVLGPDDTFLPEHLPGPSFMRPEPGEGCRDANPQFRDIFLEKLVATPEGLALYQQAVRKLRTGVLAASTVKQRVDALWAIVGTRALNDPRLASWADMNDVLDSKETIKQFVDARWPALEQAGF
jgi:CotH kinase protein